VGPRAGPRPNRGVSPAPRRGAGNRRNHRPTPGPVPQGQSSAAGAARLASEDLPCIHRASCAMAGQEGFEPPTAGFGDRCSTSWSYWPYFSDSAETARPFHDPSTSSFPCAGCARGTPCRTCAVRPCPASCCSWWCGSTASRTSCIRERSVLVAYGSVRSACGIHAGSGRRPQRTGNPARDTHRGNPSTLMALCQPVPRRARHGVHRTPRGASSRHPRPPSGRLPGWRTAASPPSRRGRSARPSCGCCHPASPCPCPQAA
jgi:hypothetical protein